MEIAFVIGILAAFLLGAYVRKPFSFVKKAGQPEAPPAHEEAAEREDVKELESLLGYTHEIAKGARDED